MGLIYLAYVIAIFFWQINNVKTGKCRKRKAIVLHAIYITIPVVLYGAVFVLLIGAEELTDKAIIGEGYARTLPFVVVGGVAIACLATLVFSLVIFAMKQKKNNAT